jgi:hypothetical protein
VCLSSWNLRAQGYACVEYQPDAIQTLVPWEQTLGFYPVLLFRIHEPNTHLRTQIIIHIIRCHIPHACLYCIPHKHGSEKARSFL